MQFSLKSKADLLAAQFVDMPHHESPALVAWQRLQDGIGKLIMFASFDKRL